MWTFGRLHDLERPLLLVRGRRSTGQLSENSKKGLRHLETGRSLAAVECILSERQMDRPLYRFFVQDSSANIQATCPGLSFPGQSSKQLGLNKVSRLCSVPLAFLTYPKQKASSYRGKRDGYEHPGSNLALTSTARAPSSVTTLGHFQVIKVTRTSFDMSFTFQHPSCSQAGAPLQSSGQEKSCGNSLSPWQNSSG